MSGAEPARLDVARGVLDHLLEGCQVISPEYRYVYVNEAAAQQGRSTRERLLGRKMVECYPGVESTRMFAVLRRCMEERTHQEMENEFEFPDGTNRWFQLQFDPVPEGVAILSIDVTRRIRSELSRKRAEARVTRLNAVLRGIRDVNQLIGRERDPRILIPQICELLVEARGFDTCCIVLWDGARVRLAADAGVEAKLRGLRQMLSRDELPSCMRAALAEPQVILRAKAGDACGDCPVRRGYTRQRDAAVVGLRADDEGFGALHVSFPPGVAFCEDELALVREVAADVALALRGIELQSERTRMMERLDRSAGEIQRLNQRFLRLAGAAQDLSQARSVDEIADIVRRAARSLTGADGATFALREGDECHHLDEEAVAPLWKGKRFPLSGCPSGWAIVHGQTLASEDAHADDRVAQEACRSTFVKGLVVVPIRCAAPVGAIGCYWARPYRASPDDILILQALADSTAVAMENVRVLGALAEDRARTRAVYDHLPHATLLWRRVGDGFTLDDWNEKARSVVGGDASRLFGKSSRELDHRFPGLTEDLARCLDQGATLRREIECGLRGRRGPIRMVFTYGVVSTDMVLVHLEDVTELRQTEEHLRLSQRLEAVGRLAGGIAHDFNNLLSVIVTYTAFAIEELRAADPIREDLEEVRMAGQRAAVLTRQLLAFGRKQILAPEILKLNEVVTGIEGMLRRLLGEDIEILVHAADDLGTVLADPGQIEQVIMNLAVNARDAMPGGGKLTIETSNADLDAGYAERHVAVKPGRYVLLAVSDTGCGMDASTRERIFEPFFTTKEKGKGTGLGLSTVYGIVKQSGGNIWVYSEQGRGSTFKIYLPRVDAPVPEARRRAPSTLATGDETVLVVEDEDAVRRLSERILRTAGYRVLTAANAGEALLLVEKHGSRIDLLLTDVVMPQLSGRELAQRLAQARPDMRVLYMSGYTDGAIVHQGVLDAAVRLISKPFNAADLTRSVREVLDEGLR